MPLLANFKKTQFRITIPIKRCSSFVDCKAGRHESESSRSLMIAQISALDMDAESGNLVEIMFLYGKTVPQASESREPSV